MKKVKYATNINASKQTVWEVLWGDATYPQWTSVFSQGSRAETDWKEGSRVKFLSGTGDGMYSEIAKRTDNEFMSFRHIGMLKNGTEQPVDEETQKWSGSTENYTLKENGTGTELLVELDITEDHEHYFNKTFPKALDKVKELAEAA
ncbi:MAG TPA: hypothetical protein VK154_00460 [Chitinophagales bacterium]|nr:hypothetical protein [Chitinophagales bacterium]